jgi:rod shape-determining protein MreD
MNLLNGARAKWVIYGVEIFLVYVLQSTPALIPGIFGEKPMLLLMCAVSISLFEGDVTGMWFGLGAGLLMDTGSTAPFGFYGLVFLCICFGCGTLVMYLMRNNIMTALILGFVAALLVSAVQWIFFSHSGAENNLFFIKNILLPRCIYSTATMPLFYYFNMAITTRLYDE